MATDRERFEEWAKEYGMLLAHDKADVALTWDAWKAATSSARERAAKVCEAIVAKNMNTTSLIKPAHRANSIGAERGAMECARAIRADAGDAGGA